MKKPSGYSRFTLEERKSIVKEYLESNLSASDLCKKYGIGATSTLYTWRSQLQESEKSYIFAAENDIKVSMQYPERKAYERRIAELEKRLRKSELQNMALNTMIDIAEEQGLPIRKKSGAKQ